MLERLKTALLITLVLSSLFLTRQQWRTSYSPGRGPIGSGLHEPLPQELMAPWTLFVHGPERSLLFGPGQRGYQESWDLFRSSVSGFQEITARASSQSEWDALVGAGALEFRLVGRVQLRMWLEALSIRPSLLSAEYYFDHMLISPESSHIYFRDTQSRTYFLWENVMPKDRAATVYLGVSQLEGHAIRRLQEPHLQQAASWLYVLDQPGRWPELWVRNERGKLAAIVNGFFSDLSLVRKIGMRDGMTMWTDGKRSVYVDSFGGIEYVEPPQIRPVYDIQERASATLSQAISFIARHGGWGVERRIKSMEAVTGTDVPYMTFELMTFFRHSESALPPLIPLVSWRDEMKIQVTERYVKAYHLDERFVYLPLNLGPWSLSHSIIPAERALQAIEDQLMGHEITNMYLAYFRREIIDATSEEYMYPVWVIEQGNKKLMINAFTTGQVTGP